MTVMLYTDRDHTASSPRHRVRAEGRGVRVWVGPYPTASRALAKAHDMLAEALARGERGDFIVDPTSGAYRRRAPGESPHTSADSPATESTQTSMPSIDSRRNAINSGGTR